MDNPDDIIWKFLGEGKKKTNGISYERAKVRVKSSGQSRVFRLGDAVHVQGGESESPWVAQIIEFLDKRPTDVDDPDVQVVDQYIAEYMTCPML